MQALFYMQDREVYNRKTVGKPKIANKNIVRENVNRRKMR